jgi:hypothetical protein
MGRRMLVDRESLSTDTKTSLLPVAFKTFFDFAEEEGPFSSSSTTEGEKGSSAVDRTGAGVSSSNKITSPVEKLLFCSVSNLETEGMLEEAVL